MNGHNIAARRPTETATPVVGYIVIILMYLFKAPAEVALAVAGLLVLLPAAVTWAVELKRRGHGFPTP